MSRRAAIIMRAMLDGSAESRIPSAQKRRGEEKVVSRPRRFAFDTSSRHRCFLFLLSTLYFPPSPLYFSANAEKWSGPHSVQTLGFRVSVAGNGRRDITRIRQTSLTRNWPFPAYGTRESLGNSGP